MQYFRYFPTESNLYSCNTPCLDEALVINCMGEQFMNHGFSTNAPRGRKDFYFLWMMDGEITVESATEPFTLFSGDAVVFWPDRRYCYSMPEGKNLHYCFIHYTGNEAERITSLCGFFDHKKVSIGTSKELLENHREISDSLSLRDDYFLPYSACLLERFFINAARVSKGNHALFRLRNSFAYLNENFSRDISVAKLAKMDHISPARYRVIFKEYFGTSPKEYLTDLRMENAKRLLCSTDLPLDVIAENSGYGDVFYFGRIFKRKVGVSPVRYRKKSK